MVDYNHQCSQLKEFLRDCTMADFKAMVLQKAAYGELDAHLQSAGFCVNV